MFPWNPVPLINLSRKLYCSPVSRLNKEGFQGYKLSKRLRRPRVKSSFRWEWVQESTCSGFQMLLYIHLVSRKRKLSLPHSKNSSQIWLVLRQPELLVSSSFNPFPTNSLVPSGDAKAVPARWVLHYVSSAVLAAITDKPPYLRGLLHQRNFFFSQSSMVVPCQQESFCAMIQETRHLAACGFAIFNTKLPMCLEDCLYF